VSPGERLHALWMELNRAIGPLTMALAGERVSRAVLAAVVKEARSVLDKIEREFLLR
jgi:hypothetical protein